MAFVLRFGWTKDNMEDMPKPKAEGWKISREKIWGPNAKRSASALFSGKLKAKKKLRVWMAGSYGGDNPIEFSGKFKFVVTGVYTK